MAQPKSHDKLHTSSLPHNEAFGALVLALRSTADASQEEIADSASIDRSYLSLLENGKRSPTLNTIVDLAGALEITAPDFLRRLATALERAQIRPE